MSIFQLTLVTPDKLKVSKHNSNSGLRVQAIYCYRGSSDGARCKVYFIAPNTVNSPLRIISGLIWTGWL